MAGNRRGKLKEQFEGVHRNFEWSKKHMASAMLLIQSHNPNLTKSIESLAEGIAVLDELAMKIYARL